MASHVDDTCDAAMPPKDLTNLDEDESKTMHDAAPSLADASAVVEEPVVGTDSTSEQVHALELEKEALGIELGRSHAREARLRATAADLTERLEAATAATVRPENAESKQVDLLHQHIRQLQETLDEVERGRQHAVFKISELAARVHGTADNHAVEAEWIQKAKHDFELLNQRTRLLLAQQEERHAAALDVAMRRLALEHAAAMDKLRLDNDIRWTEWRHEESRRMKEVEAAMEADKSSVRLAMKHNIESTRIHQRVTVPSPSTTTHSASSSPPSSLGMTTVDADTLVRMQLDALRTRRLDALKKLCLVRISIGRTRLYAAWMRWNVHGSSIHARKHLGAHSMATALTRCRQKAIRRRFQGWCLNTRLYHWQSIHNSVLNQILAVQRLHHVVYLRMVSFGRWRGDGRSAVGDDREMCQLRKEVTMLHDELAKTKAETWRCKRQMLQQFKQSAINSVMCIVQSSTIITRTMTEPALPPPTPLAATLVTLAALADKHTFIEYPLATPFTCASFQVDELVYVSTSTGKLKKSHPADDTSNGTSTGRLFARGKIVDVAPPQYPGRVKIEYKDGSAYHANPSRLTPQLFRPNAGSAQVGVIVTAKTDHYRRLARTQITSTDIVLEIGCDLGITVDSIADIVGPSNVIGVDKSHDSIQIAKDSYPRCRFVEMDIFHSRDDLIALAADCTKVLIDINGNRLLPAVVEALRLVLEGCHKVDLVIVKSVEMHRERCKK
ncbi:hypothetical protein DYB34_003132 [Aphanomyces astaci]|uniref:Methyltransferase domain-containing protein n=2 Tax=Aphanomyces astaci TaxID=112090 RepID=A0A3R7AAI9_APHAT|nr:hypothetical protein DYB34_003132 [Aphanomyces astaci]